MANASQYYGQDLAWLKQHQIELRNCLSAITTGQQYQINGRSVTRADYNVMAASLSAVTEEINRQQAVLAGGQQPAGTVIYASFGGLKL